MTVLLFLYYVKVSLMNPKVKVGVGKELTNNCILYEKTGLLLARCISK